MTKLTCFLMALVAVLAIALAPVRAKAADLPIRQVAGITNTSPTTFALPLFQGNGQVLAVQVVDSALTNNTCVFRHLIPVTSTRTVTNTVATLTYTTTYGGAAVVTNGAYLIAGDNVTATFGTTSTGTVVFVRNLAK
jgi:hypothetical protein